MADIVLPRSIGELIDLEALSSVLSWTAGGASDSVTWTGLTIDRGGFLGQPMPLSADVDVYWSAKLASGATLALTLDLQHSPDNSTWTDFATVAAATVATGPSGGGTLQGVTRMAITSSNRPAGTPGVDLKSAKRYVRLNVLSHLSATVTDTAVIAAVGVFAGYDRLAAPQT
jgi:hypothetical protein